MVDADRALELIAEALLETHQRDAGNGVRAHKALGIEPEPAAALLVLAYERVHRKLTGESLDEQEVPESIEQLLRCAHPGA